MINFQSKNSTRALACLALASIAFPLSSQVGFSAASQDPKASTSGATIAAPAQTAPVQATTKQKNLRYLRVGSKGAKAFNLEAANGVNIADLSKGLLDPWILNAAGAVTNAGWQGHDRLLARNRPGRFRKLRSRIR